MVGVGFNPVAGRSTMRLKNTCVFHVAVLRDPELPGRDAVESGEYHADPRISRPLPQVGDVLLLYCTRRYGEPKMKIPAIGIVTSTNQRTISYRCCNLSNPVGRAKIKKSFDPADFEKFKRIRSPSNWVFDISMMSFNKTIKGQRLDPRLKRFALKK